MRRRPQYLALTGLLLFFACSSVALASDPKFSNVTIEDTTFTINTNGLDNDADNTFVFEYDFATGGPNEVAVTEQIRNLDNEVVYEFGGMGADDKTAGHYQLEWDGTYKNGTGDDGEFVPEGKYKLYLFADTHVGGLDSYTSPLFTVNVEKSGPMVELTSSTDKTFDPSDETYKVDYNLDLDAYTAADVHLNIYGPLENAPQKVVITDSIDKSGDYTISWNGEIDGDTAPDGEYTFTLQSVAVENDAEIAGNIVSGTFTLKSTVPSTQYTADQTLSGLSVTPDVYSSGYLTLKYYLNGSNGNAVINAAVYNSNDTVNPIKTWQFTNQSTGSNSIVWNGVDKNGNKITVGGYIFKVWGSENNKNIVPQQTSFIAQTGTTTTIDPVVPTDSTYCVYPDVKNTDPDCNAFKYVRSIGAITGTSTGELQPSAYVQRDQMAKIVLEMYSLAKTNACKEKPFPDVDLTAWSADYICRGVDLGVIKGYSAGDDKGMFRPGRSVNRAEVLALLLRPLLDSDPNLPDMTTQYSDVENGVWFEEVARISNHYSLFTGSTLKADAPATRREVAVAIYRLHLAGLL